VAEWLFEWLDCHSPFGIADVTIYLCYHPNDQAAFLTAQRGERLAAALLEIYRQEKGWDEQGFGDLTFDLPTADRLEFRWQPTETQIPLGAIGLVRRAALPLSQDETIVAELRIEQGAEIARHLDRWQSEARWQQPVVYLPHGRTTLLIGAKAGFDLYAPSLSDGLALTYDVETDEWMWEWLFAPWRKGGRSSHELALTLNAADSPQAVRLLGGRLPQPQKLGELEDANRLEPSVMEIIGCVLPKAPYGVVPADAPPRIASATNSAVRLPNNGWLYFDKGLQFPCAARPGEPEGFHLTVGQPTGLGQWQAASVPQYFHGALIFNIPIVAELALGPINGNIPDDLFINYRDVLLGRPPLTLVSPDGRNYKLVFNPHARHPVFKDGKRYDPPAPGSIKLDEQAEFILGTTIYRLRRKNTESYQSPLVESARGKAL
jgi:hypothetical protein